MSLSENQKIVDERYNQIKENLELSNNNPVFMPTSYIETKVLAFEKNINKTDTCWIWTRINERKKRYGRFYYDGKTVSAHRFSYELYKGKIPEGLFVLHSCDNPPCVNPEHLRVGTHMENMNDRRERGRTNYLSGERIGTSKLKQNQVLEIRALYAIGEKTHKEIGEIYNVTRSTIWCIINKKNWRYLS